MSANDDPNATGLHPTARPAEKRQDIRFAEKDRGLREDVHNLATIIGEMLREQGGEELLRRVETGRRAAIARREGDPNAGGLLKKLSADMRDADARDYIRAFSTYFQMVNTAEQVHRLRRRRDYLRDASVAQPGGLEDAVKRLRDGGLALDEVLAVLRGLRFEPVFTAQATEPTRRTVLRKQQHIVRRLIESHNPILIPQERAACFATIRNDITTIWQTEEHPGEASSSFDELEYVLFFMTDVIYRAIPVLYESLAEALASVYEVPAEELDLASIIQFGSWIGGDLFARPDTTARTIRQTLARQRSLILNQYHRECGHLMEKLSQSESRIPVSDALKARTQEYSAQFPEAAGSVPPRHRDMPYRVFLRLVRQRLQATYDDDAYPYESPAEFLADIRLIADSLEQNRGRHAWLFSVRRLMRRIDTFGFHFMTLDIRQSAVLNRRVVGRCLGEEDWLERPAEYRAARIRAALERNLSPVSGLDNESRRDLAVFQAIAYCRRKYGRAAIGPYVVSRAHGIDDVLSVLLLASWGDLRKADDSVPLDVAPYFETVEDLKTCADVMNSLLQDPLYREHVERRGNRQIVMISYSDSNKDAGMLPARWTLYQAQEALVHAVADVGIELDIFHGRGGTISRGGGQTHATVVASPPGAIGGRLRVTEQGELINTKFGLRGIALRTLEQAVSSLALATAAPSYPPAERFEHWQEVTSLVGDAAREAYQQLIRGGESFFDYFRAATPVDVIERMRPAEFRELAEQQDVFTLRGIPWDFAWAQSRHLLPGWYGAGRGLARAADHYGIDTLRELFQSWPFFNALIEDLEIVLAKADLHIASRYSELAEDLHPRFFPRMRAEFNLCVEQVLAIKQQQVLLEGKPALRRSIRLRNPYVDAMSLLQIDLLRRWRDKDREDGELFAALLASVDGIARGLQDTG